MDLEYMSLPMSCTTGEKVFTRGIFAKENPLQESYNLFILQFILLALAYQIVYFLLRPLKQTRFVCSVVAGILIGPHMLGKLKIFGDRGLFPDKELNIMGTLGSLGIAYFIFLVAVKMDITMLWRTAREATIIGSLSVLMPFASMIPIAFRLPMSEIRGGFYRYLFVSGLSVTRFADVADAVNELNMLTSQQGQLVLASSMINEVFAWMSLIGGICYRQKNKGQVIMTLILTMLGVGIIAVALRAFAKKITGKLTPQGLQAKEPLITSILIVALLMAFVTDLVGSLHLGILIIGLVMPNGPPLGSAIIDRAEYMVKEFLMPVFYVMVGYGTEIFAIDGKSWEVMAFVLLGFTLKFIAAMIGALACRKDLRSAALVGLLVNVKGPTDLFLYMRWKMQQEMSNHAHAMLVVVHVMITALLTPLIEKLYSTCQTLNMSNRRSMKAIQTSSSYAEFKILCCVHGVDNIPGIIALLEASNGMSSSKLSAVVVHLNDLVGRAAPVVVRNDKQLRRVESKESDKVAHEFEIFTRKSDNPIALVNYTVVAPYRAMHENICHLAEQEGTTLIILPYRKVQGDFTVTEAVVAQAKAIRNLNCTMLKYNPCAMGILVNKGLGRCLGRHSFSCNVAVIFSGGHDDREALAYASRMLMHPSVHVTLLRLIVRVPTEHVDDAVERKLDGALVEEFKIKTLGDKRAKYYEEGAVDLLGTLNAIRSLGDGYNLVMTGRQSSLIMMMCEELLDTEKWWGENPELGIIGDFIASDDYNGGKSSAVIMQRYPSDADVFSQKHPVNYEEEYLLSRLV